MSIIQAIILGIVQGITEFLPVSSSGHLAIIQNIFHIQTDGGLFFDVMLHLGTLVAIFVVYRKDILRMIVETVNMCGDIIYNLKSYIQNQRSYSALRYRKIVKNNYRKFVVLVLVSTIPTGIIGYRKGNGGKSECDTDRSGDLPDPDFHFAGGIRENTERQKDTKGYQLRKWIFDRCSTGLCHTSGTFPLRYDDRGVPDERI